LNKNGHFYREGGSDVMVFLNHNMNGTKCNIDIVSKSKFDIITKSICVNKLYVVIVHVFIA